jgi:monofunctional biosynthetic peptidoglycan transglycosylase
VKRRLVRLLLWISAGLAVLAAVAVLRAAAVDVAALRHGVPARTSLMRRRAAEAAARGRRYAVDQRWVPYDRISPLLRHAVLVAEDDAFFVHGGLDWNEIRASARQDLERHGTVRGGSTITQQLAKNLYLGNERTLTRKLEEVCLALRLEHTLSKRRIFELYLNEIEWGDGIFGIEAAARRDFGVSAMDLDPRQATLLAAIIINPRRYSPLHPAPRIERRVRMIAARLHRRGVLDDAQYRVALGEAPRSARGFFDWLWGTPPDHAARPPADTLESPAPADSDGS